MRVFPLAASLFLFFSQSSSQQTAPVVQRDPQAVALLQASVKAMGGTVPADSVATGNVTIVAGSLQYDFPSSEVNRVVGIVGAHELTHKLGGIGDLPYDAKNPNLMSFDNNPDAHNLLTSSGLPPGLQLTPDQIQKLFDACKKLHP